MKSVKVIEKILSTANSSNARGEGRADLAAVDLDPLFREGTRLLIHNLDEDGILITDPYRPGFKKGEKVNP